MGYAVDVQIEDMAIPPFNVSPCLMAVNALHTDDMLRNHGEIVDHEAYRTKRSIRASYGYGFVENPDERGFATLVDAMRAWGYDALENDDGAVEMTEYIGEKWGYDELFFRTIAPFVADSGEIRVQGEDGQLWRYLFHNGEVRRQKGRIVYEDE